MNELKTTFTPNVNQDSGVITSKSETMKRLYSLMLLLLTAFCAKAQLQVPVVIQVHSPTGASVASIPLEIAYDSLPGGVFFPTIYAQTDVNGFFTDTIQSINGRLLRVKLQDCNGATLMQAHPVVNSFPFLMFSFNNYCASQQHLCAADFSSTPNAANPMQYGFILNQGSVPPSTRLVWSFGDGNSFTAMGSPIASHTYTNPGIYTVTVSMVDSSRNCNTTYIDSVQAFPPISHNCFAGFQVTNIPNPTTQFGIHRFHMSAQGSPTARVFLDFGDSTSYSGPINTLSFIDHQYLHAGVFHACITITDTANNCSNTYCDVVFVHPPQVGTCHANFTAQYVSTSAARAVQFTNASNTSLPSSPGYLWQFGDGTTSTVMSPAHTYAANGTYVVSLTMTDSNLQCTDTFRDTIYVGPATNNCQASFIYQVFHNSAGANVAFINSTNAQGALSYVWDFGNGMIVHQDNPIIHLSNGAYRVCLTVTSTSTGCVATYCDSLIINTPLVNCNPSFTKAVPSGNAPVSVSFVNTSTGGNSATQYFWDFGDGTQSFNFQGSHTYTSNGGYLVTLVMFDSLGHCQAAYHDSVVIGNIPQGCQAFFSTTPSSANPNSVSFNNLSTSNAPAGVWYQWNFGDGSPIVAHANPTHTYAAPGTYTVCLTVNSPNCTDTYCMALTVGQVSNTYSLGGIISGPTSGIGNVIKAYLFEVQSNGGWIPTDTVTAIDTAGFFYYTFSNKPSATYAVLAELTTNSPQGTLFFPTYVGNSVSWNSAILIYLNSLTANIPWNINMVDFLTLPAGGGGTINGNVLRGNLRVASGNMPNVTVQLLNANLSPIRTSRTDAQGQFNFLDLPMGSYFVHIDYPGRPCTPVAVNLMAGQTTASGINFTMNRGNILTSVQEAFAGSIDKVYPNPVRDQLYAEINLMNDGAYQLEIYSLSGKRVMTETRNLLRGNQRLEIPTQDLSSGLYLMRLTDPQGAATQWKVSKQ